MARASKKATAPPRLAEFLTKHARWIVAALLALFAVTAWSAVWSKSTTFDEIAHMAAGTAYWKTGDFRLHPENGILPQRLEALPLVLMGATFPDTNQPEWWASDLWRMGYQFFYSVGNNVDRMLWWSRGTIVMLGVILGGVVYHWSRRLFGVVGGLVSLAAYVFCPSILAHSALATSDLAATLMFTASLGAFWIVLHRVSAGTVALSAVVMGLLFVSKMSAVLILPVGIVLLAIRLAVNRPLIVESPHSLWLICERWKQLAILCGVLALHAAVVAATIWLFFGFHATTFRESEPGRDKMYFEVTVADMTKDGVVGRFVRFADEHRLLPQPYLHGFAFAMQQSQRRTSFLNGERSQTGWRTFFPYALLVKTPLPTFGLMIAAAWATAAGWSSGRNSTARRRTRFRRRATRGLYLTAPLWVFLSVYWFVAIRTNLNIGHRHILPTYPLMFILCGAAGYWIVRPAKWPRAIVATLVVLLAGASLAMYPNYLAYFNQLAGGPRNGYRHLVDSSLDWGQDLPGLKHWLDHNQDPRWQDRPVYLAYFGMGSPEHYGIHAQMLPSYISMGRNEFFMLEPGTYCISATMLTCIYTLPWEKWNERYEEQYWRDRATVAAMIELQRREPGTYERLINDPERAEDAKNWSDTLQRLDALRFARLCAYLWQHEPDDSIGYSILIYHLDDGALDAALNQPVESWN